MGYRILGDPFRKKGARLLGQSGHRGFQWNQELTFEGGNIVTPPVSAWDSTGGAGVATILTTTAAAIRGNFGCEIGIPNNLPRFGILTQPTNETIMELDMLFDPNSIVFGVGESFICLHAFSSGPGGLAIQHVLENPGGVLSIRSGYFTDGPIRNDFAAFPIPDRAFSFCTQWKAASQAGADDGIFRVILDGVVQGEVLDANNDQHDIDSINIGALSGIDPGTSRTIFFDNIRWANKFR